MVNSFKQTPPPRLVPAVIVGLAFALLAGACGPSGGSTGPQTGGPQTGGPSVSPAATSVSATSHAGTGDGTGVPATPGSTTAPKSPPFTPASASWRSCAPKPYECATVEVPLDYTKPDGTKIKLAVKRLRATDPAKRIGTLFFNPGGPGASGTQALTRVANDFAPATLAVFDLASWDPRGVGGSVPLTCERGGLDYYQQDLGVTHPGPEVDKVAKKWADLCESENGNLLPFVGTREVALDLESLRQAVGDDKVTYAGFSYGTLIGLVYAELFPTRIRAMVLDGIVDPTLDAREGSISQAVAIDKALQRFIDWCPTSTECPLKPDAGKAIDDLFKVSHDNPLPGTINNTAIYLSPTLINFAVIVATYDSQLWPRLAEAIRSGLDGDGALLGELANAYLGAASPSANMAVNCIDSPQPKGEELQKLVDEVAASAPRTGVYNANSGRPCEYWPVAPKPLPTSYHATGSPPIMVWGTTGDNATPYPNAVKISKMLDNARLVTLEANRHAALGANTCVADLQSAYLVSLAMPPDGTKC